MNSNSFGYIIFLFVLLALVAATHRYKPARWILLLAGSYFFYFTWQPFYLLLLLFTTSVGYYCGLAMAASPNMKVRRRWLRIGVASTVLVLFFFKYSEAINATIRGILHITGSPSEFEGLRILLPVGISFYTFQTLSYLFDVYYKLRKEERHFGYFATYVAFFAQLLSGPIERSKKFIEQVRADYVFDWQQMLLGLRRIAWGIFKKMVVADRLGVLVDHIYNDASSYHGAALFAATLTYVFQLYIDFSGYTDIAIGSAKMFGIDLTENFNFPLTSRNVTDFWRRWHITLGNWLRDYVYNPILFGYKKYGNKAVYFSLLVSFVLCGIWHGPKWTFIIFGFIQALALIMEAALAKQRKAWASSRLSAWYFRASWLATFSFILFSDIFFRSRTLQDSMHIVRSIFSFDWRISELVAVIQQFSGSKIAFVFMWLLIYLLAEKTMTKFAKGEKTFGTTWNAAISAFMIACVFLFGFWGEVVFVYFQF